MTVVRKMYTMDQWYFTFRQRCPNSDLLLLILENTGISLQYLRILEAICAATSTITVCRYATPGPAIKAYNYILLNIGTLRPAYTESHHIKTL